MNYANPPYPQNPPYPAYPPQNYARPKKKNELWFVLAGVCLILNTLLNILPAFLSLLSYPNVENIALFVEQLVFLALGVCCIVFRKNHGVLAAFCIVLACIDLLLLVLYATIRIEYGFTMFIWAFMAALILVNARRSGRGVALLVIASLFVLLSTGLFVYECVYVISSYLLRSTRLTPWVGLTILSRLNMVFAQVFLIVAAFMPNKTPIRPNIPFQSNAPFGNVSPMPPYAPNTPPQSPTPMNQAPYAPSPAQPIQPTPPTQPSVPSYQTDIAQTASVQLNAPVQSNAPIQPNASVQPTTPTAEAVPVSPYADAPTVVVAPTTPTAPTAPTAPIPQAAPTSPASPARTVDVSAQLRSLQTLLEQGVITEGEYTARKNRLLGL